MAKDKKACVDLPERCQNVYWYRTYTGNNANECISIEACDEREGFLYHKDSFDCLTAAQCREVGYPYAHSIRRLCETAVPEEDGGFDEKLLEFGVYNCGNKLLDTTGKKYKCIPSDECDGFVSYERCVSREQCVIDMYMYIDTTDSLCVWPYKVQG